MLGMPSLLVGMGPLPPKALAALPPPASLPTGTQYEVTDYGGNAAIVINGVWRFVAPFRTTWANRPPVALVSPGTELQATDFNSQKWICDGTVWRPAQGRVSIKYSHGQIGAPLATLQNTTGGLFTIPGGSAKIGGGMIIPGSALFIHTSGRKVGAAGTAVSQALLGSTNSLADISAQSFNVSSATLTSMLTGARVSFGSSKTSAFTNTWIGYGSSGGSAVSVQSNLASGINTDVDMFVNLGVSAANAADSFELFSFEVWLEA